MKKQESRSGGSKGEILSGFRELSHDILRCANKVLLKKDFLPLVSRRLLKHSGCDDLELWVEEVEEKSRMHYRCRVGLSETAANGFEIVPHPMGKRIPGRGRRGKPSDLEMLCRQVVHGRFDPACPSFTGYGSFWTNDTKRPIPTPGESDGTRTVRNLQLEGDYLSLALIPILIDEECMGLLQLKCRKKDFFVREEIAFYEDISQTLGLALVHQYTQLELRERLKELTCLYGMAQLIARSDAPFEEIVKRIVELLPPAWLYPEIASARIVIEGKSFTTSDFWESPYRQVADIVVKGRRLGFVEVAYSEKSPIFEEGPFLPEERSLIDNVAREVAHFYERRASEEEKSLLQEQLRHADRLATIGQLAAGVAHELNEPLGNILGFAQLAQKIPDLREQARKDMDKIVSASLHAREIIKKLMTFARQHPSKMVPVNLNEIVEDGIYFFEARCAKAGIELVRRFSKKLPRITAEAGQLNQVLVNLVVNAVQAMPKGGTLSVETRVEEGHALLIVEDTGEGMTEEVQKQIFIPFFTTKDVDEGTGLGLPVVHGIVTSHKGSIQVKSRVGAGTRFEIRLPVRKQVGIEENL